MYHKASKGKNGTCLTKDVDMISKDSISCKMIGKQGSKKATSGLDAVAGSKVDPRSVSWDRIPKG